MNLSMLSAEEAYQCKLDETCCLLIVVTRTKVIISLLIACLHFTESTRAFELLIDLF